MTILTEPQYTTIYIFGPPYTVMLLKEGDSDLNNQNATTGTFSLF